MRKIAFILSLTLIFTIPWEDSVVIPGLGTATKFVGFGVAAFWLVAVVLTNRVRKPSLFHIVAVLFVLWNAVSIFWSADANNTASRLITFMQLLVLIFILWDLYTTPTAVMIGLQVYILGAFVSISSTVINYFSGNTQGEYQRYSANGFNPDEIGVILALGIPVAWYLASSKGFPQVNRLLKSINYAYIPAALLGIALSGTRTALICMVPAMAFGLASLSRLRNSARILILLLFIVAVYLLLPFVPESSIERLGTTGTELTSGDLNQRREIWGDGFISFTEKPLIGVGSNMYRSVNDLGKVAHNSFISVLVEVGMIGLALFTMILLITFLQTLSHQKWDAYFWLTILATWFVGASALSWEHAKATWLFMSLLTASAAINTPQAKNVLNTKFTIQNTKGKPSHGTVKGIT